MRREIYWHIEIRYREAANAEYFRFLFVQLSHVCIIKLYVYRSNIKKLIIFRTIRSSQWYKSRIPNILFNTKHTIPVISTLG